jgi:glycerophosphoryl diester phosphodiesterase
MIFIAHRGESYDAPENTLAAINLAWQRDADAVEIDVHLTKDERIVVIHDNNTWKLDGRFHKIKAQTLQELKRLDAGKSKGSQWTNERIPTLQEVLVTVPPHKNLIIEIKCGSNILSQLKRIITDYKLLPHQIQLIGFDLNVIKNARKIFKENEIFWVRNMTYFEYIHSRQDKLSEIIKKTRRANLDGLNLSANRIIDRTFVDAIKAAGLKLYIWIVNDPREAKRLMDAGIDGITTDRQQWLKAELGC